MSVFLDVSLRLDLQEQTSSGSFQLTLELQREVSVLAFFGPSGAGKTLALRALAGLIRPTHGTLSLDQQAWADTETGQWLPAHERRVGYVPQSSALFPHLTVLENVCFGLEAPERRAPPKRVHELIERMRLEALASSLPTRLSGGERQRVSLARALARSPRLLLLDEPMSALDDAARVQLQSLLRETIDDLAISTILVTHDPHEAASMAEDILLFERGRSDKIIAASDLQLPARDMRIQGEPMGAPETLPDGRVRVQYERATITADPRSLARATEENTSE
jgi:molybdate transport system ATP-binding protein